MYLDRLWLTVGLPLTGDKSTRKYLQDEGCFLDAGKITVLLHLLEDYAQQKRKVLIFSQESNPLAMHASKPDV